MKDTVRPTKYLEMLKPYLTVSHKAWESKYSLNHNIADTILKLDWNESSIFPNFIAKEILRYILKHKICLNWYPDINNVLLLKKISQYCNVKTANIQYFNGSDNALEYIVRAYVESEEKVIIHSPTYDNFRVYVESCGGKIIKFFNSPVFEKNTPSFFKFLKSHNPKMVYIVNPNNPTGVIYYPKEIEPIAEYFPKTLFVIDEAYFEFCGISCINLVKKYKNIIITRTFTKAFGLGAFRLGYVIACKEIIDNLNKIRVGKNISTFAQIAGIISLDHIKVMKDYVKEVNKSKNILDKEFKKMGLRVIITPANFILISCKNVKKAVQLLAKNHIYVRSGLMWPHLENYIRVTVGDLKTTKLFIERFKYILNKYESCFI